MTKVLNYCVFQVSGLKAGVNQHFTYPGLQAGVTQVATPS